MATISTATVEGTTTRRSIVLPSKAVESRKVSAGGRTMHRRFLHLRKACPPIDVRVSGSRSPPTASSRERHCRQSFVRQFGRLRSTSPEQPRKAWLPVDVSVYGKISFNSPEQWCKAYSPTDVNASGRLNSASPKQSRKTSLRIAVRVSGRRSSTNPEQP
jgi:hypothetical protein